ncbi:MAG: ABC transporter permease [Candidatus Acidiferrales bacterium]
MGTLLQDLRYAIRTLAKNPGFTLIAVLTLALGIGANTALFSVVNGVLLDPLPFHNPAQLASLFEHTKIFSKQSISYPNLLDWQRNNTAFTAIAGYRSDDFSLTGVGEAERVKVQMVSADFFSILGVNPVAGRIFMKDDDIHGAAPVVLISQGLWKRKFGSALDAVGRPVTLNGSSYTIVGVIPDGFHLTVQNFRDNTEVYVPLAQNKDPMFQDRRVAEGMDAIGRLKPGVTIAQAQADMDRVSANLAATYPDSDKDVGVAVSSLKAEMVGSIKPFLLVLLGAVGFVLLIACVNVGNLLLARSTGRTREFAIRAAMGASQGRIIRQLLTESVLLSLAGGALGLLFAAWGTQAALRLLPEALPRSEAIGLDGRVLAFTLGVSVLAGIIFGLAPALKTARTNLQKTLNESGRGSSGARHRAQGIFVMVEMALAVVLLSGAGLMIRSLVDLWSVDPGFNPKNVLEFGLSMSPSLGATPATTRAAMRQMHAALAAIPGVQAVSLTAGSLPMSGDSELPFWLEGQPKPAHMSDMSPTLFYVVEPGYLKVMGIPLKSGRFVTDADNEHVPMAVVIDEMFAAKFFPHQDPIGKYVNLGIIDQKAEIVGVVGHVKHWGLDNEAQNDIRAQLYMSFMQIPESLMQGPPQAEVVVRTAGAPQAMTGAIRQTVEGLNGENVVYETETMEQVISDSLAARRFSMILLGIFAALALLLSSIGIYGVISYFVGQRTREIGIRVALGAQKKDVLQMVIGQGSQMALAGIVVGIVAGLLLTRLMGKMLFGVSATDPWTFAAVALLLAAVSLLASYVPARRAMRVDPVVALRYE